MTYGLRPDLLKAKLNAPSWAKELVDGENASGIKFNTKLSKRDRQFITDLYGTALEKVEVSGSVHIVGEEHDWGEDPSLINRTKTVASAVHADALEYVRAYDPIIFKWGGEQRVEVHLHHRRIKKGDIEMAVNVLLYHGKGTDNTDLDDLDCRTFTLRAGQSSTGTANLDVDWLGGNAEPACGGLDIDVHASGLKGGDLLFWPNPNLKNKATVTIKLTASPVSVGTPIDAPAAPSIAAIVRMADPSHDVNGDGEINAADLLLVSQYFGRIPPETPPVDVNNDDTVTITDLVQVAQHLQLSPVPAAPSVSMPAGLTYRTVEGWIDTARVESDGSRAFKIGIANLEALLRLVVPEETALLHNYPNPFNPETWIPYHLSEPAHVDLTIYTVDGKVVRHLDLGHQVAGFYQSKARAAHWDGRNNVGERVASGVYFYTLTAGEFTATRKMLILK
ncbi:T9SS type A sorting domain-containing protein [Candidatus Poribacteria bacterium]|nr:T9SS type A sorting domain-containing protein [Candidatus Poribacteria bacterium]